MASPDEIARIINATASGSSLIELDARGEIEAMLLREATMEDDLLRAERTCLAHSEPKKCLDVLVRHTSALLAETQRRVRVQKGGRRLDNLLCSETQGGTGETC